MTTAPQTPQAAGHKQSQQVQMGERWLAYPDGELGELRPSHDIKDDPAALHQRMEEDGYLYIPGLINREKVLAARARILEYMAEHEAIEPGSRPLDGVMGQYGKSINMLGRKPITHEDDVKATLEAKELFDFFQLYYQQAVRTFDYKWLRAVGHEQCTGAHYDVIYMGRGSQRLHTTWLPLMDIPVHQGTLCICRGSHNHPGFQKLRDTYGKVDVDRDGYGGWFSKDPLEITEKFGGQWQTTNFAAGDALIFGLYTLHASTTNTTDHWRLSCDVRFQPAADPVDERWVGENPTGHYGWGRQGAPKSMEEARAEWGV